MGPRVDGRAPGETLLCLAEVTLLFAEALWLSGA